MTVVFIPKCIPVRSIIWFMIFTCVWFFYMMRVNMSIIILAMVEPSKNSDNTSVIPECKQGSSDLSNTSFSSVTQTDVPDYGERFAWDSKVQGQVLGSYFYGFVLTGLPSGYLAERYGPRKCVLVSFAISGLLTIVGPWTASLHYGVLIASRFLIGAIGGVVYPCMYYLIARYAPPDEKGKFTGALMGNSLGTVVTWPLLGAVIETFGWTWAFYTCGIVVLIWVVLFMIFVYDSPEDNPLMSDSEKKYIVESLSNVEKNIKKAPPYRAIAKSVPFWALLILHFGNLWGLFFLLTAGPNFMSTVLGFTLGHTGFIAALPYLARAIFGFIFGAIGDFVMRKQFMSKTLTRKVFLLFSHILPGVLLLTETLVGCDVSWAIVLITMSLGMNGASTLTNLQNSQDLSPNYAPTIYGIINSIGSITGIINPLIVGYITADHNGLEEWKKIFYLGSSVYIASAGVFIFFGTGEMQPWNEISVDEEKDNFEVDSLEARKESDGIHSQK